MKDLRLYINSLRHDFSKQTLDERDVNNDPVLQFEKWFKEAVDAHVNEPNAMTVTTATKDGKPSARILLLRNFNEDGFVFYTNYNSEKGKAITTNPHVCLSFFWHSMERQVIIKGIAQKTAEVISDNYFASRPDGSKLGAIVSNQSEVVPSRDFLEDNLKQLEANFDGMVIPRPEHWGGFLVTPLEVEFWQGRPNRLHDRIRYQAQSDFSWKIDRLSP